MLLYDSESLGVIQAYGKKNDPPSLLWSLPAHPGFNSQGHSRETCWQGLMQAGYWEAVSSPLGLVSNIVNFICHLITSMGYCCLLLSSAPTVDTGHGTRSASAGSPQSQKEVCPDLPATFLCFLPSWPTHPVRFPPKHCLPGVLKDSLALTTYSWLQPQLPHPSGPWSVLPPSLPASSPLWVLWDLPTSDRGCPDSQGHALSRCMPLTQ